MLADGGEGVVSYECSIGVAGKGGLNMDADACFVVVKFVVDKGVVGIEGARSGRVWFQIENANGAILV